MRKLTFALISVLIAVFVIFSILDRSGKYNAERLLYKTLKTYKKITANPDVAPPKILASVENNLKKVISDFPDGSTTKIAYIQLIRLYLSDNKNDEALLLLNEMIEKYEGDTPFLTRVYFLRGLTYEKMGKWEEALQDFKKLRDEYSHTSIGLEMPIHITQHYMKRGEADKAKQELRNAVAFYEKIEKENSGTVLGYASANLLIQTYMRLEQYEDAGQTVEDVIFNYPSGLTLIQQLPNVELIFVKTLNKPDRAIDIYRTIVEKTEDVKLKEFLQNEIDKLESGENKGG